MDFVAHDHDYCVSPTTGADESLKENEALRKRLEMLRSQVEGLQLQTRCYLELFAGSDDKICYYTRFASYHHFLKFWKLVESAVMTKMIQVTNTKASTAGSHRSHTFPKLPPFDELLLFLMYLSLGQPLRDLAERFGIHQTTVSRIITTWANFLYQLLGGKRLWLPREKVQARLPAEFASYPDTQVVLDCTEIYYQTPSDLLSQSEVFSTYKSHSTLKAMIGMAPHGAVTFVSALFAGSMSDRDIFKQSGIIKVLQPDMAIMVDKSFHVDNLAPCKVYQTQSTARLRIHVEHCIRRLKGNRLFDRVLPVSACGIIDKLFSVACYLVNYQNGPLMKS
uniref:Transposase n=1 Tax=Neogobius melanostomus TaxID=47308 RepID=A0A8C6WYM0_9GOBI